MTVKNFGLMGKKNGAITSSSCSLMLCKNDAFPETWESNLLVLLEISKTLNWKTSLNTSVVNIDIIVDYTPLSGSTWPDTGSVLDPDPRRVKNHLFPLVILPHGDFKSLQGGLFILCKNS